MQPVISEFESKKYLEIVKEIKNDYRIYDVHVHPFEIFFNEARFGYSNKGNGHLPNDGSFEMNPPKAGQFLTRHVGKSAKIADMFMRPDIQKAKLAQLYNQTGLTVFESHMRLSGVDQALLLQVAPASNESTDQLDIMQKLFGNSEKFSFSWSVPNNVPNENIYQLAKYAKERYDIKAVKLHPNVTEINLCSHIGKERVESILDSCNKLSLALIVHGGRSPLARTQEAMSYGKIQNLKKINWSISTNPVVIAHAGFFGCGLPEIQIEILPTLKKMMSIHNNLVVDVSGLNVDALSILLKNIDIHRVLFGSDALYEPQWKAVVKLMATCEELLDNPETGFLRMAHENPEKFIFGKDNSVKKTQTERDTAHL